MGTPSSPTIRNSMQQALPLSFYFEHFSGWFWVAMLGAIASYLSLFFLRRFGPADMPDARRLHAAATPRGGAIGVAALTFGVLCYVQVVHGFVLSDLAVVCAFAALGALDDFKPLSAQFRLLVQLVIALIAVAIFLPNAPVWLQVAASLSCVALVNMANFMDGSNGLLAMLFVIFAGTAQALGLVDGPAVSVVGLLFIGFIPFNFPDARMFMGDVGSYLIGAALAVALLQVLASGHKSGSVIPLLKLSLLLLPIALDATLTIIWRAINRKPIWRAHREHLYQWLRRTGWSAQAIVLLYAAQAFAVALIAASVDSATLIWLLPAVIGLAVVAWFAAKRKIIQLSRSSVRLA